MSNKIKSSIASVVFFAFGIWFYLTPYITIREIKSAVAAKDSARLASHVDFPALKESLKTGFNAKLASEIRPEKDGNPLAAAGLALATAIVNPMVDALVTPENLATFMKGELPQADKGTEKTNPSTPNPGTDTGTKPEQEVESSSSYEGFNRFVMTVKKKDSNEEPLGFVFTRQGLFSWKLSALRLPM